MKRSMKMLSFLMMVIMVITGGAFENAAGAASAESRMEEKLLERLSGELGENYRIEAKVCYLAPEYIRELQFNSRQTDWFGYYLSDVEAELDGQKYIFTVNESGETTVELLEAYDDSYDMALRDLAIGFGVMMIYVTVALVSEGVGASAVSRFFIGTAKDAAKNGILDGMVDATLSGIQTAMETDGDLDATLRAAAREGSEAFMKEAIIGIIK